MVGPTVDISIVVSLVVGPTVDISVVASLVVGAPVDACVVTSKAATKLLIKLSRHNYY